MMKAIPIDHLRPALSGLVSLLALFVLSGYAGCAVADGRLIATGGVTAVEGAAGGGIVPWALIAGYGTRDEIGVTAFHTDLSIDDFQLYSSGVAVGVFDRLELSYARQAFSLGNTVPGQSIRQDIFGAKLKLAGDAVFDQDSVMPQIALGVQYKKNLDFKFAPKLLGARSDSGTDIYLAATKVHFAALAGRNVLWDVTLRATKANQMGLLGFGGDLNNSYRLRFEGSAGVFLNDTLLLGAEYRAKPNNLGAFREDPFKDVFLAWVPNKHLAFTAAYALLGQIANKRDQHGTYLSVQLSY